MLDTEFHVYQSPHHGHKHLLRTLQYSVPDDVAAHIDFVQPTTRFGRMQRHLTSLSQVEDGASAPSDVLVEAYGQEVNITCNATITPTCLLQLYNTHYGADPRNGNKVGFASFLEEYARYDDLAAFESAFAPWAVGQNFTEISINGGLNDQVGDEDSGEANLDCQYIKGVSAPVPEYEFSTAGRAPLVPDLDEPTEADNGNEPYLEYLTGLMALPNSQLPQVISHSYGEDEQVRMTNATVNVHRH